MGITELADLIRRGCDQDEQIALAVSTGPHKPEKWTAIERHYSDIRRWHVDGQPSNVASGLFEPDARHVARHDPHRVLAEVAAKRCLLDQALAWEHVEHEDEWHSCHAHPERIRRWPGQPSDFCTCGRDERVLAVLQTLAAPYQEATA